MTEEKYAVYDFRKAGSADDSAESFGTWIKKAAQTFADNWTQVARNEPAMEFADFRTQTFESANALIEKGSIGWQFSIEGDRVSGIWHISKTDMMNLVNEMICVETEGELPDRDLTPVELSLAVLFIEKLAESLGGGWPKQKAISVEARDIDLNPKRIRLCRARDLVTTTDIVIKIGELSAIVHWISPKQQFSNLLDEVVDRRSGSEGKSTDCRPVVELVPIEVVGFLGKTKLSMRRIAELKTGDVVKLNQRIDKPIVATVDGKPFYECWPGKIGETQALEIANCL